MNLDATEVILLFMIIFLAICASGFIGLLMAILLGWYGLFISIPVGFAIGYVVGRILFEW